MKEDLKKIANTLAEIVQKLGAADKAVLQPYIAQMNETLENIKKSGQANLQANMAKLLDLTEKIKEAKIGDLPGLSAGISMIQSTLKNRLGKEEQGDQK